MGKLWVIIKREYVERVRNRWFIISTVFGPLLFAALMFIPPWIASRSRASAAMSRIVILDATGAGLGRRIAAELNGGVGGDTSRTQVILLDPAGLPRAESVATERVRRGEVRGYLVLGKGLLTTSRARYAGQNASAVADMQMLERAVQNQVMGVRLEQAGVDPHQTRALTQLNVRVDTERLTKRGRAGSGQVSILFAIAVAATLYLSIFIYGQNVLRGVMEEKQTRVAEVVMSSVPATKLLAGKVLGVGAVGVTQIVLWTASSLTMMKVRGPVLAQFGVESSPIVLPHISVLMALTLFGFFVLGYVFYAALFAAIGAIVSSEQEAQQAQIPIALMLAGSIAFLQAILVRPDGGLAKMLSALPFSTPIVMPLRMSVITVPRWEVATAILSLVAGCYIAVWVAARIYRVGMLMYGKRPTLREIVRWLRYAY